MRPNPCLLILPFLLTGPAMADHLAYDDTAKQLMKDSAAVEADSEAAQAAESLDSANRSVEKAKNTRETMDRPPAALPVSPEPSKTPAESGAPGAKAPADSGGKPQSLNKPAKKRGKAASHKRR
jgi:hypothetical protein